MSAQFGIEQDNALLIQHAAFGDCDTVRQLLSDGAFVNNTTYDATTALHSSCLHGHHQCAQLLLEAGANVNAADVDGGTPLCAAASKGAIRCIQLLLMHDAHINPPFTATSPLHEAALSGHSSAIQLLIRSGAGLNTNDLHFGSPLHICADRNHVSCAEILLKAGAQVNNTKSHVTPLHVAATKDRPDVVRLLLNYGANVYARNNWGMLPSMLAPSHSQAQNMIMDCQVNPFSLMHLCRLAIRTTLTPSRLDCICRLTLPVYLTKYVEHELDEGYK